MRFFIEAKRCKLLATPGFSSVPNTHPSWLLSDRGNSILNAFSWATWIFLLFGIVFSLVLPPGEIDFGNSLPAKLAFFGIFLLIACALIVSVFLWVSMIWFCIRYYRGGPARKLLLVIAQLIAFQYASAALYFLVYKRQHRQPATRNATAAA